MLLARIKSDSDKFCDVISKTLDVDVLIVDSNLKTVSNTCRYFDKFTLIRRTSVIGRVISGGEVVAIDDRSNFNSCKTCPEFYECEMTGIIGVPIFYNDAVIGAIALVLPKQRVPQIFKDVRNSIEFVKNMSALLSSKIRDSDDYNTLKVIRREREVLIDAIADAIVSTDDLGRIVYYNKQFPKYFGIGRDCRGELVSDVIPHRIIRDFLENQADVKDKIVFTGESGQLFFGFVSCSSIGIQQNRTGMLFLFRPLSHINRDFNAISEKSPRSSFVHIEDHLFPPAVIRRAKRFAVTSETVLIQGEDGTAKELLAQCIHEFSDRGGLPMVTVNCDHVFRRQQEAFLFGELGQLQLAHKSTLFFSHFEKLPIYLQKRLAAFCETRTLRHKDCSAIPVDVRMIFSTSGDAEKMVGEGAVWDKLYYRISQNTLQLPPLHSDAERLRLLLQDCLQFYAAKYAKPYLRYEETALESLCHHPWPENVREVETMVDRLCFAAEGNFITTQHLARFGLLRQDRENCQALSDLEKDRIQILLGTNYSKDEVARILGISRATLYRKIKTYQL